MDLYPQNCTTLLISFFRKPCIKINFIFLEDASEKLLFTPCNTRQHHYLRQKLKFKNELSSFDLDDYETFCSSMLSR